MIRRLFAAAYIVSLLLCVATVALWVRGYFIEDGITRNHLVYINHNTAISSVVTFTSTNGSVGLQRGREYVQLSGPRFRAGMSEAIVWSHSTRSAIVFRDAYGLDSLGFASWRFGSLSNVGEEFLFVPLAPISALLAVLPVRWAIRWRRHRFIAANHLCPTCGYDLRATPDRCPECGSPIPAKS